MILVSGGTGTLGRELVRRFVEAGERVRVMTRDPGRARGLGPGVEFVGGDLADDASVAAALRGCRAVVAAAHGFVGPGRTSPEAVDRDGNRRLIRAAREAGIERFVLVSVVGAGPKHPMSLMRAKFAAELALRESGLAFTIVRAPPFMETWIRIVDEMLDAKGHALVFGPGTNPVNFVSVRDIAALAVLAVQGAAPDELYELGGPENVGLAELAQRVIQARGRVANVKHVPLLALRAVSFVARAFSPSFARLAQAAVLMNTTDMTIGSRGEVRPSGVLSTSLAEVLQGV